MVYIKGQNSFAIRFEPPKDPGPADRAAVADDTPYTLTGPRCMDFDSQRLEEEGSRRYKFIGDRKEAAAAAGAGAAADSDRWCTSSRTVTPGACF